MLEPTPYPHINTLLDELLAQLQTTLGEKLVGLYLYGSLVAGDFDSDISDIDLLAAVSSDIDAHDFDALNALHGDIVANYPQWYDRIEIAYLSLHALKTFKTERSPIAIISPGEPFNIKDAGDDWLMNWYFVREYGITLYGSSPESIIEPISKEDFIQSTKAHVTAWREWIDHIHDRTAQAYAILTMCRGLYTFTYGEQVSKRQAALWAAKALPKWASLIHNALLWRQAGQDKDVNHEATLSETRRFVHFVIQQVS